MPKLPPRPRRITEKDGTRGLVPTGPDAHLDLPYQEYLEECDLARDPVYRVAMAASTDIRFRELLRYLALPSAPKHPLVYWVKRAGIDLLEMMTWVGKAQNARTLAIAQRSAPKINEHMSVDAESRMVACERCDGLGWVQADEGLPGDTPGYRVLRMISVQRKEKDEDGNWVERTEEVPVWIRDCPMGCDRGKVRAVGDAFAREKILEQVGVINRKGMGIQIINNLGGQAMPSAVSRLAPLTIDIEPG